MANNPRRAILLMNLGSPKSTAVKDVRAYLNEFLMDKRVIDMPLISRALLVRGIIVPFRAPKSAEAYKTIWTKDGSPLIVLTRQLRAALQQEIEEPVAIAMRYGGPSPKQAYDRLLAEYPSLEEVLLLPLYPHYAMSSYETAVEYAKKQHRPYADRFRLTVIKPFYNEPGYIHSLGETMRPYLDQDYDHILFSYHGIPARHIRKTDITGCHCLRQNNCCDTPSEAHAYCYRHQVFATTKLVTQQLGIPDNKFSISFQSRLGKGWLEPFTDVRLEQLPGEGIKKLLILCPAFVSDCLETLEEIEERGRETFLAAGGQSYHMIPCLNTHPLWVKTIAGWIGAYRSGDREMVSAER
ncbi:ferrochelatase [Sediminibacterium soli]|uniref:ferrochelatase n=1 Tax=Sediminibacterium soli TaxID=2698829 RepID=UPI00137B2A1F|nr:ferrochelatase [Sediminibacterium soli]NCI47330.1 ferrochelatase [Sediminibacterium soli]